MDSYRHKARKNYKCDYCKGIIKIGEIYELGKDRIPVFETDRIDAIYGYDGKQTGIEYVSWKICSKCLIEFEEI